MFVDTGHIQLVFLLAARQSGTRRCEEVGCIVFGVCVSLTDGDLKTRSYKETYGWLVITPRRNGLVILLYI